MKIFNFTDSHIRNTYYNEFRLLKHLNSELVIKFFDKFEVNNLNSFIITEYCEVSVKKSEIIYYTIFQIIIVKILITEW